MTASDTNGATNGAALREQLLDAVVRVMEEHGPTAVTTKRIAREAGCSEGSIYNHFADKDELLACAFGQRIARFPALLEELAATAGTHDVPTMLAEVARQALGFFRRGVPMLSVAVRDDARHARARELHAAGHGPWRTLEHLADWLRAEQRLGRLHPDADADAAATALLGSCLYIATLSVAWGADLAPDDDTTVDRAVRAVWRGLAPV